MTQWNSIADFQHAQDMATVSGQCQNCGKRPATQRWGGTHDGVSLARNQSLVKHWCELCVVKAQVAYMSDVAAKLPERLKRLAELESE